MALPQQFWDQLPEKSDKDLYDILSHGQDYLPEALAAVKEELQKRNLPAETVVQIQAAVESQKLADEKRAQEPLGWGMRIIIFAMAVSLFVVVVAFYYESKGYKRKSREALITWVVGVVAQLAAFGLMELVR